MTQANIRDIKQVLNNPALLYGMIGSSGKLVAPVGLDDHYGQKVSLYDHNGNALRFVDRKLRVSSMPYTYDIQEGNVPGHSPWWIFGANADVDAVEETLWGVGGIYVPPTAGMQLEIVSTSDEDAAGFGVNPAGTGVHRVAILYLDSNYVEQTEEVNLDGTTVVTTTSTDILRVNDFRSLPSPIGATKAAVGTIDLRHLANTPIYAEIAPTKNEAPQTFYTVPAGHTVYINLLLCGGGNALGNRFMRFIFSETNYRGVNSNGVWYDYGYWATQDGSIVIPLDSVAPIPEKVDIRLNAVSDSATANAQIAGAMVGWIEEN